MAERKAKRTKEELVKEVDDKIAYHERCIVSLKAKKEEILNPKPTAKAQLNAIMEKAKENGLTPDEIAKKLGIEL